jgi:hypothetical protein
MTHPTPVRRLVFLITIRSARVDIPRVVVGRQDAYQVATVAVCPRAAVPARRLGRRLVRVVEVDIARLKVLDGLAGR